MTARQWALLLAMTGSYSMILLDMTGVGVALPSMQSELTLSQTQLSWVVNVYLLVCAVTIAPAGRLGDMFGRVPLFISGVGLFGLASAGCGLATQPGHLLLGRGLQGLGAALMQPASSAIVADAVPDSQRGRFFGIYNAVALLFLNLGPLLGGILTELLSWRWLFWVNLPVAAVSVVATLYTRPAEPPRHRAALDPLAIALLMVGLTGFVFGLQEGPAQHWSALTLGSVVLGAVMLAAFVRHQLASSQPLLHLELLQRPGLRADCLVLFLVSMTGISLALYPPILLQNGLDWGAMNAGLGLIPLNLPLVMLAPVAGRWLDRYGVRRPVLLGVGLAVGGLAWWVVVLPGAGYPALLPGMLLIGVGYGLTSTPLTTDALTEAGTAHRAEVAGLTQALQMIARVVALALFGAVLVGTQAAGLSSLVDAHGGGAAEVSALEGVLSHDSERQAQEIAQALPGNPSASALVRAVFIAGIRAVFLTGGVLVALAWLLGRLTLKRGRSHGSGSD